VLCKDTSSPFNLPPLGFAPNLEDDPMTRLTYMFLCLSPLVGLIGCGSSQPKTLNGPQQLSPQASNTEQTFDLNGDQKPDAWRYYKVVNGQKKLTQKSFDFNFDGKVDLKRHYNDKNKVTFDEADMDFDGTFDMKSFYLNDVIERKELNIRGDEKPDVFKYYKSGKISYLEGDRDADGTLDYWEYYRDGKLVRRGRDRDGDGKPDHWDELD
jgi:hypothetical protein